MEVRGRSISYSAYKKKKQVSEEEELIQNIKNLEENSYERNIEEIHNKQEQLEKLRKNKLQGIWIRSRAKWIEEGEKPTRYFCNMETRNFTSKIIPKLVKDNGETIQEQFEILNETKQFYEKLYSKPKHELNTADLNSELKFEDIPKLSEEEAVLLEGKITLKEASKTLQKMKANKSPGSDGFSTEFFKVFWKYLGVFVVRSINYAYDNDNMSITQRHGIITLLPKGDKPRQFLRNWRPITLLNTIYKIASGTIATRIKNFLDKLINSDQTGFISNRYIGENIRLIYDIMQYTEEKDIPGLLLLIDFEKAFDTVSWNFIQKTLTYFNFGPDIHKWVKLFYNNSTSAINQGGNLSETFNIQRGCRQGDPLSPYIFLLCAEILAIKIRKNKKIKGITINDNENKISQLADDTSIILDGSKESLMETIKVLGNFSEISGLKVNFAKTNTIRIGSKKI